MARKLGICLLVIVVWYGMFWLGLSASSAMDQMDFSSWLNHVGDVFHIPASVKDIFNEGFRGSFLLSPGSVVALIFLAWFGSLPKGHGLRIALFLTWQILLTIALFAVSLTPLPELLGRLIVVMFNLPTNSSPWAIWFLGVYPAIVLCTLPIHCAVLWFCFYRSAKDKAAAQAELADVPMVVDA